MTTAAQNYDVADLALADCRPGAHRVGGPAHARAGVDPQALRSGAAAGRHPARPLPARDHGDREPRPDADRRRRGRGAVRVEPALDPGRRGGRAGQGPRRRGVRDQRRGQRGLLRAHQRRLRQAPEDHDGRRRRRDRRAARRAHGPAQRGDRRHRGDDHRSHPPARARGGGQARVPDRGGQRGEHEAHVRQPLRHRPVHARRDHPRHQHPDRGQARRRVRLRLVRQGRRDARQGPRRPRDRVRGRPAEGPGGRDGRLRGDAGARGRA